MEGLDEVVVDDVLLRFEPDADNGVNSCGGDYCGPCGKDATKSACVQVAQTKTYKASGRKIPLSNQESARGH